MKRQGLTNYKLARMIPCSPSTIANWLGGSLPKGVMKSRLLEVLGVSEDELFGNNKKPASVSADGWQDDVRSLKPELLAALADFVALAKGDQETALRYLSFANQELRSRQ